ncbi:hypothetical protein KR009_006961, partial [Drosophila setifemur]
MLAVSSLGSSTCNCHDYLGADKFTDCISIPSNPYGIKDTSPSTEMSAWTSASLQSTTGYYSYDPTLAAYG